jgi:hypothetical protein
MGGVGIEREGGGRGRRSLGGNMIGEVLVRVGGTHTLSRVGEEVGTRRERGRTEVGTREGDGEERESRRGMGGGKDETDTELRGREDRDPAEGSMEVE